MPPGETSNHQSVRLGLGTVQFGSDYGATNANGKPSDAVVQEIYPARCVTATVSLIPRLRMGMRSNDSVNSCPSFAMFE